MTAPLLDVRNLEVVFPDADGPDTRAVDGVDLEVHSGEIHGLVGESGSGKSVTARTVLKLLDDATVTADALTYDGESLPERTDAEMRSIRGAEIGMIFQDSLSALNPVMTVGEQIAEVVRHHTDVPESTGLFSELRRKYVTGTDRESPSWQRAVELLETVGIPDPDERATEYPHQLSDGQRQRVMIAQALAGDPSLIIADEPTTALDVTVEAGILDELRSLCDDLGVAILLITHDLGVVSETCDRVTVMYSGSVMERGPADRIFEAATHPYTKALLRSVPEYAQPGSELETVPGSAPDPRNRPAGCPFRDRCPEAFDACTEPLPAHTVDETHMTYCHAYAPEDDDQPAATDDSTPGLEVSE